MTKYLLPIFDVYRVRGVSLIKFTYFDSCLVDILSLIEKKSTFCFSVSFWFSKCDGIGMDLSHVTASVEVGQQYSRPGLDSWPNETERVLFLRKLSQQSSEQSHRLLSYNKSIYSKQGNIRTSRSSPKLTNIISRKTSRTVPEGCTQGKFG